MKYWIILLFLAAAGSAGCDTLGGLEPMEMTSTEEIAKQKRQEEAAAGSQQAAAQMQAQQSQEIPPATYPGA